jgi:PhnB protein
MESVIPYLSVHDAAAALAFYAEAFGAVEDERWTDDGGRVGHAQLSIGDAVLFLSDEYPEVGAVAPRSLGGTTVALHLTVPDADAAQASAVAAGATQGRPVTEEADGRRSGWIVDPFGHRWNLSSAATREQPEGRHGDYTIARSTSGAAGED